MTHYFQCSLAELPFGIGDDVMVALAWDQVPVSVERPAQVRTSLKFPAQVFSHVLLA